MHIPDEISDGMSGEELEALEKELSEFRNQFGTECDELVRRAKHLDFDKTAPWCVFPHPGAETEQTY